MHAQRYLVTGDPRSAKLTHARAAISSEALAYVRTLARSRRLWGGLWGRRERGSAEVLEAEEEAPGKARREEQGAEQQGQHECGERTVHGAVTVR